MEVLLLLEVITLSIDFLFVQNKHVIAGISSFVFSSLIVMAKTILLPSIRLYDLSTKSIHSSDISI